MTSRSAGQISHSFQPPAEIRERGAGTGGRAPAAASLEKLPDHTTYVLPARSPDVTGYSRMVDTTLE